MCGSTQADSMDSAALSDNYDSTTAISYCQIYSDLLPNGMMSTNEFMTNCATIRATGWNETEIGFHQLYSDTTYSTATALTYEEAIMVDVLPSRAASFDHYVKERAVNETGRIPPAPPPTCSLSDCPAAADRPCSYALGTLMETIADCEQQLSKLSSGL